MKSPIYLTRVLLLLALLALPVALRAELKTFTVDQTNSRIFITGTFAGTSFSPQASGSLTTSYTGTIEVDLTDSDITFIGNSLVQGVNNGNWRPGLGGTVATDTAPGNYGGQIIIPFVVTAYAAVRETLFDLTSPTVTMAGGAFSATNIVFSFPPFATTVIDYNYSGLIGSGSGSEPLTGSYLNNINSNATLVVQGTNQVLTIPVDISGTATTTSGDLVYRLRGKLVAKAPAPVVPIPLKITAFSVTNNQVNMSIGSTIGQHFTVLGSTNFINWITNDAFTASVTNTSRAFAVPSAAVRPNQYFRVRQD